MGQIGDNPDIIAKLQAAGFTKCLNQNCDYWLSPEEESDIEQKEGGVFRCPRCKSAYPWVHTDAFQGDANLESKVGISMTTQGELAENIIQEQGELPGYGKLVWWSTLVNDPIDGATEEWAIEVKSVSYDAKHHRFVPGTVLARGDKVARAQQMGYDKLLGVLVLLNYQKSVADIYVREMSVTPWKAGNGKMVTGFGAFRSKDAPKFLEEVSFKNPFLDPGHEAPHQVAKSWFQGQDPHPIWNRRDYFKPPEVEDIF